MTENPETTPEEQVEIIRCHLDVTMLLRSKQRLYGVQNGEYLRYAQYCTRRIARLRHLLHLTGGPKFELGPEVMHNKEHLELLCLIADCAWARYRDLKTSQNGQVPKKRAHHAMRRLRKCQKWWKLTQQCAQVFGDERTQLEVDTFSNLVNANFLFEKGQWADSLQTFLNVSSVFEDLKAHSEDKIFSQYCQEELDDIAPLIEYCKFSLGSDDLTQITPQLRDKVRNISTLSTSAPAQQTISEITFHGESIPVNQESLRSKLSLVVDLIDDSSKSDGSNLSLYDRLIAEAHSCRTFVKGLLQKSESEDLIKIDKFLMFNSFIATVERSRAILSTCSTPSEAADFTSRTYARILEIKPQFGDDVSISALEKAWHACKDYRLALALMVPGTRPHGEIEAVVLLERAAEIVAEALAIEFCDPPQLRPWIEKIQQEIRVEHIKAAAAAAGVKANVVDEDKTFLDDLESYNGCAELVTVPPKPRTITPKPFIFDLAKEYIEYPDMKNKLQKKGWARLKFW